jgi:hypothetical protein
MHLSTTSSQSLRDILPSDGLNESTAKILFSLRTSSFVKKRTYEVCLIFYSVGNWMVGQAAD